MSNFSDFFCRFMKICILIALAGIFAVSIGMIFYSDFSFFNTIVTIGLLTAVGLCVLTHFSKLKNSRKIMIILSIAFIIRLVWTVFIDTVPTSDFATVYEAAKAFLQGNTGSLREYGYLARFPHLVPMMLYMSGMIKIFGTYHIIAIRTVALILSVLNVFLVFKLSENYIKTSEGRLITLSLATVFPPFISYCSGFCTETIGVTLFLLTMILFHKANNCTSKRIIMFFVTGCLLYMANMFRSVAIIFLIAFVLYIFIFTGNKRIISFTSLLVGYIAVALAISYLLINLNVIEQPLWKGKEPSFATLMLKGSNSDSFGMWNEEDAHIVDKYLRTDDLSKECFKVIKTRISERTLIENIVFYGMKFFSQWSTGDCNGTFWSTLDTPQAISPKDISPVPAIFQLTYSVFIFFSLFIKKDKNNHNMALLYLLLCGFGTVFVILETQARYSYIVSWIFIIIAAKGLENIKFFQNSTQTPPFPKSTADNKTER